MVRHGDSRGQLTVSCVLGRRSGEQVRKLPAGRINGRPESHPPWFDFLARQIPPDEPRARRDAVRFLSLLKAVTLCRRHSDGRIKVSQREVEINFADYVVAHRIVSRAFASTFAGVHPRALTLSKAVRRLNRQLGRPASVKEIARHLGWDQTLVYKYVKESEKQKLVQYESGSHLWKQKRLLPGLISRPSFLPDPNLIFPKCPEVGDEVRYFDPLTGKEIVMRRGRKRRNEGGNEA
jgi:Sigma-70 region 3